MPHAINIPNIFHGRSGCLNFDDRYQVVASAIEFEAASLTMTDDFTWEINTNMNCCFGIVIRVL